MLDLVENTLTMSSEDFLSKAKILLKQIIDSYDGDGVKFVELTEDEIPNKSVCDNCKGYGTFIKHGQQQDCVMDRENGACLHRFYNHNQKEEVFSTVDANISLISELLSIDKL